jgi:hypothetical protein
MQRERDLEVHRIEDDRLLADHRQVHRRGVVGAGNGPEPDGTEQPCVFSRGRCRVQMQCALVEDGGGPVNADADAEPSDP